MQQVDDPPYLLVGTEVSAKYKGAFCEAKVSKVVRNIKVKVAYKQGLGSGIVSDFEIKATPGQLRVGTVVEVRHPERKDYVEATITKIQDCSQYTVVFDDGDITTLRRTALCLKSGRHFNESETLDQLPLTHPEHFGNPVVGGRRGRRRGQLNDDSSDDGDESDTKEVVNEKEEHIGKVVCVETESKKKDKEKWFPALVVAPTAQATVRIRVKDEYLVRSFKDGRYYTVPKKEATEFTRDAAAKQDGPAVQAALEYLDNEVLPPHWDRDSLFALSNSSSDNEDEIDSDSSDDEPREEKDRFVAQLYKYMDDRGTPLNKVPSIQNRDVDLYRLFRAVQKRGGYNRVTSQNQWKSIAIRLGFTPVTVSITNLVKQAFKKFLQPYGEFHRKLGCSMLMSPRNSNRSKGRSLVRANSVASPKLVEPNKETIASTSKLVTASYNPTTTGTTTAMATTTATATSSTTLSTPTTTVATAIFSVTTSTTTTTITSAITSLVTTPTTTMTSGITSAAVPATVAVAANASTSAVASDSEDTSESSQDTNNKNPKRKLGGNGANANTTTTGKVKTIVEKYEEKLAKDDGDVPLSKIKAAAALKEAMETKEKDKDSGNGSKECSSGQVTRDSSPAGSSATTGKKEKHQRKQSAQNDDKRSKRKKDENIVEKIDTGDFIVETGDKLKVYYHEKRVTYEAKVIEIAVQRGTPMYLVHYTGWNNRYDEWVPRERIAENLTKGLKQKGRSSSIGRTCNEKNKENPSKPPAVINTSPTSSSSCSVGATTPIAKGTTTGGGKRGRWRSDSMPPRSSTPSSVASNSSRTKSPATSSAVKRRPQRQMTNTSRRVSAVSDVSIPTEESDTDSDEPVRRPTRGLKTNIYSKSPTKSKASASAPNSQSDTDENDNDDDADGTSRRTKSTLRKGSHIDLNQICSELKGLQNLKTIGDVNAAQDIKTDFKDSRDVTFVKIKREKSNNDLKTLTSTTPSCVNMLSGIAKNSTNIETKVDISKRISAEVSSGSESFGDDDSQSSDKTTQLENMTKKFQQIINADKQRAQDKAAVPTSTISKMNAAFSGSKVVEKIIKDRENEKRQESLKIKPGIIKDETKTFFANSSAIKTEEESNVKYEDKKPLLSAGVITPVRFDAITTITNTPKYASVIVEKPLTVSKKLESALIYGKKLDLPKRIIQNESSAPHVSKKFAEPSMHKEIVKVELAAACSPSSISSISSVSSTNSSISSATSTSRSLPDMSKLDISGSSSMASSSTSPSYSNLMKDAIVAKPISPDVYEFKDPEPFEFEMRKSSLVGPSSSATSVITANLSSITSSTSASTGSLLRNKTIAKVENYSAAVSNTVTVSGNRKKRGSPMKEALKDSSTKHLKLEERTVGGTAIPILADAKLLHHSLLGVGSSTLTTTNVKGSHGIGTHKSLTSSTIMHAPSAPKLASIHQGSTSTITSVSSSQLTAFDALRKSPNFNLNINALNEELAQTVQETTRALTDAMQCPLTPTSVPGVGEVSPNKTSLSPRANYTATLAVTQTLPIVTTVATKLYTPTSSNSNEKSASVKEDLSNVFGLSFGPGSSNKDSKFEFEDAKKLLSASVEAFDLDPTKFESKPTPSIADKVLKAISQKKEEEETKKQEAISRDKISAVLEPKKGKEPASSLNSLTYNICPNSVPKSTDEINLTTVAGVASAAPNLLINEPLKINTELPGTNSSLLSGTLGSFLVAKRGTPPLTSPDCKIGLLESIGTKTQLTETIQKLECAIQRRTPVTSHSVTPTTPLSVAAAETYSEESNDSTDSERRLVIEDVIEENVTPQVEQKSSPLLVRPEPTKPITSITSIKLNSHTLPTTKPFLHSQHDITTLTPIKLVSAQTNKVIVTTIATTINASNTMTSATVSSRLMTKLHGSTTALIYQPNINKTIITSSAISNVSLVPPIIQKPSVYLASNLDQPLTSGERIVTDISGNNFILQSATNVPISTTIKAVGAGNVMTKNVPTTSTGVPIDLPDIPASVVVASSAIPSVMAAAHAAAAALQTSKNSTTMVKQTVAITSGQQPLSSSSIHITPIKVSIGPSNTTSTVVQGQKMTTTFKPLDNLMNSIGVRTISTPVRSHSNIVHQLPTTTKAIYHSMPAIPATVSSASSTSGFYLNPLTELRPDDGLKPLCNDMHQQGRDKEKLGVITLHSPASIITQSKDTSTTHYVTLEQCANITSNDHHNDAINQLLCEETIPGSPASVITTREDSQERIAITGLMHDTISGITTIKDYSNLETNLPNTTVAPPSVNSSPNDSASQEDESSEDLKKTTEQEIEEIITRKRRRVRKQQDDNLSTISGDHLATQQSQQHTKRKRSKKNAAGSDSDDNSDAISQRSNTTQSSGKQQAQFSQQQQQHQQRPQQLQVHNTTATGGSKSCPYNFLVQLDPSLSPDQCISILLKQIQDLRKTYNIIKSDLASIDRRRKKLRRREREKKQQQQQQHQQQQQQHQQQQHNQQQLKIIG